LARLYLSHTHKKFTHTHTHTPLLHLRAGVPRNLLLRFKDDSIDESNSLAGILQASVRACSCVQVRLINAPPSGAPVKPPNRTLLL